jgi:hypothetical protein
MLPGRMSLIVGISGWPVSGIVMNVVEVVRFLGYAGCFAGVLGDGAGLWRRVRSGRSMQV